MKRNKLLLSLFALLTTTIAWADVEINETNFPDENFRNWILSQSFGKDGVLTDEEIANVKSVNFPSRYKNIQSLEGIKFFTALTSLFCNSSQLTSLDVSGCTALTRLSCNNSQLTSLDVTGCTALTQLSCYNNQLTSLDVSGCTALTSIICYQNQIKGEPMDAFIESLTTVSSGRVDVIYNENEQNVMTRKQVAAAMAKGWESYYYYNGRWTLYDGAFEDVAIDEETFPDPNFRSWVLSQTYGADGVLTEDEVMGYNGVTYMWLVELNIQSLKGIEHFPELTQLECGNNQLTELDVSKNTKLRDLNCFNNKLTTLDVSKNTQLTSLSCSGNQLTELNVTKNTQLVDLYCDRNQLTSLNLSKNTWLSLLWCQDNQLTELDVSKNTNLSRFQCYQNQIKGAGMDVLVNSLPAKTENYLPLIYNEGEQNEITPAQVTVAMSKGWIPQYYDGTNWLECTSDQPVIEGDIAINQTNFPDYYFRSYLLNQEYGKDRVLTKDEIAEITSINVYYDSYSYYNRGNIESLKGIEYFTALTSLNCAGNKLTELDVSKNTALTILYCYNNYLTKLDVSGCTELTQLYCDRNKLSSLDVSVCAALTNLTCYQNEISGAAMTTFVESLPIVEAKMLYVVRSGNQEEYGWSEELEDWNEMTTEQVAAAKAKGWTPYYWDAKRRQWQEYAGIDPSVASVEINETNFPDVNFRNWLLGKPYGYDGLLTEDEIAKILTLAVYEQGIHTLQGIEHFTALEDLYCSNNQLTSLDVSGCKALKRLYCHNNQLTSLNVSGCTALIYLICYQNQIKDEAMDALAESLPTTNSDWNIFQVIHHENEGNVMTTEQVAAVKAKGWTPLHTTGERDKWGEDYWEEYAGSTPDGIAHLFVNTEDGATIYDLNGRQYVNGKLPRGINIIHYSDGTTRKVLMK